jgi:predicted NBD/HSP70 family sugar kinase
MADLSLGIDIGGTFTDIVIYDPGAGRHHIWKELTTPGDPAEGVVAAVDGNETPARRERTVGEGNAELGIDPRSCVGPPPGGLRGSLISSRGIALALPS